MMIKAMLSFIPSLFPFEVPFPVDHFHTNGTGFSLNPAFSALNSPAQTN